MAGKLRKMFTNEEIISANGKHNGNATKAAEELTALGRGKVSRQMVSYWMKHLDFKKKNGEPYIGTTVLDRSIRAGIKLRTPSREDDKATVTGEKDNTCILVIPDLHAPYHHPDTVAFLSAIKDVWQPTRIINLGDETDGHALSMHDSDPSLDAAGPELAKSRIVLHELEALFPEMDIMHSNHGSLVYRRAFKSGIPAEYIKPYREILFPDGNGQGWEWHDRLVVKTPDGEKVLFQHQSSGDTLANAAHERCSIVEGHEHGKFEIRYRASPEYIYYAMTSGCLVDNDSLAFAYGKLFPKKPIIGCSIIVNSQPILIPMQLSTDGRWTGNL